MASSIQWQEVAKSRVDSVSLITDIHRSWFTNIVSADTLHFATCVLIMILTNDCGLHFVVCQHWCLPFECANSDQWRLRFTDVCQHWPMMPRFVNVPTLTNDAAFCVCANTDQWRLRFVCANIDLCCLCVCVWILPNDTYATGQDIRETVSCWHWPAVTDWIKVDCNWHSRTTITLTGSRQCPVDTDH